MKTKSTHEHAVKKVILFILFIILFLLSKLGFSEQGYSFNNYQEASQPIVRVPEKGSINVTLENLENIPKGDTWH